MDTERMKERPMETFNPKILDASIRDVASYLSDNQKVDLLLYAMRCLKFEGRCRAVIENAIQSCLQVSTLTLENIAKARILRARARIANGWHVQAHDDLQAALAAEPDNPEAKALLHQRSVTVEKLLAPLPASHPHHFKERISNEIWREVALHLPRRDLKALLLVPHPLSRIASQLLFWELDLHFSGAGGTGSSGLGSGYPPGGGGGVYSGGGYSSGYAQPDSPDGEEDAYGRRRDKDELRMEREEDAAHAQRSADILTRIITDAGFASAVRTLRIYALRRTEGGVAFQTGMLMNALPRLVNLRNVHLSATSDGIVPVLRVLQTTSPRLRGLSLKSPDAPADLAFLELRHLAHFSYATGAAPGPAGAPSTAALQSLLAQNRTTLRTIALDLVPLSTTGGIGISSSTSLGMVSSGVGGNNSIALAPMWTYPASALSTRNLTSIFFTGAVPLHSTLFEEVLANGRQLEMLDMACAPLECISASAQIRSVHALEPHPLPFLKHFALTVTTMGRRVVDRDLFPALAEFLRGREGLRSLHLVVPDEQTQRAVGFDAAVWGVLPSLQGLKGLKITYPPDLAPGLAAWLIPRGVLALRMTLGGEFLGAGGREGRDVIGFLSQLRHGVPPGLRFVGLSELPIRAPAQVVESGFPSVRVLRIGADYWTVHRGGRPGSSSSAVPSTLAPGSVSTSPTIHPNTTRPTSSSSACGSASASVCASTQAQTQATTASTSSRQALPQSTSTHARMGPAGHPHPHSHAHTNGGGISSTGTSVAAGGVSIGGRIYAPHRDKERDRGYCGERDRDRERERDRYSSSYGSSTSGSAYGSSAPGGYSSSSVGGSGSGPGVAHGHGYGGAGMTGPGVGGGSSGASYLGGRTPAGPFELEQWPRRRALYHATEWLEWLGCEDAMIRDPGAFSV